jgi:hypothetical protein
MTTPRVLQAQQLTAMIPTREIRTVTEPNVERIGCAKHRAIGLEIVGSMRDPLPGSTAQPIRGPIYRV